MKNPHICEYAITRLYMRDRKATLDPKVYKTVSGWIRSKHLKGLTSCSSAFPDHIVTRESLRTLMQVEAFFKKSSTFSTAECESNALFTFMLSEKRCRISNRRLDHYLLKRERLAPDLDLYMTKAERWISTTLGPFSKFMEAIPKLCRITAGATSTRPRADAQPVKKISLTPVCTPRALPYLFALAKSFGYRIRKTGVTLWNRVEFVSKNWKTLRTIGCEPEGNIPLQLAFDSYAKTRLRLRGIDLRFQSRNQRMALDASISGKHATVDVKTASDTVCINAVSALLSAEWYTYLADIRCPLGKMPDGSFIKYAKFSSMGNGATFTLETLIFAAACHAVGSKTFSVYGDDIIIETELVPELIRFMRFLGFIINQDKSHVAGPFRESCGMNAYEGADITPFYIRDTDRRKAILCHNINGLSSICTPGGELEDFLENLVFEEDLPFVPFNGNTLSGILIDIPSAYAQKLIHDGGTIDNTQRVRPMKYGGIQCFKGYTPKSMSDSVTDRRALFLWQFLARDKGYLSIRDRVDSSSITVNSHKYVRSWVHWIPPVVSTPVHLYRWTERLARRKAG